MAASVTNMRNDRTAQGRRPQADADNVIDLGSDRGFKHRWLDRLQDADPPRHSIFAVAYAAARFTDAKAAPKVWAAIAKIAARAHVSLAVAKRDLQWLHANGWLAFLPGSYKTKVRVLTLPAKQDTQPETQPLEADLFDADVARPRATSGPDEGRPRASGSSPASYNDHHPISPPLESYHERGDALTTEPERNRSEEGRRSTITDTGFAEPRGLAMEDRGEAGGFSDLLRPGEWEPGPEDIAFADRNGWDAESEFEKFDDYHKGEGSRAITDAQWSARWRRWIRRCDDFGGTQASV